ncbi:MAG: GNAT family N-acetyltransferase [Promethearchaeota archaeon]|jgi:GNAT superfamily N-acetyltransferase
MTDIVFRHYEKGDEKQLATLFNLAFGGGGGPVRTTKNWVWRYVQSPGFEPEMCHIAEDSDNKRIVGAVYANLLETVLINGKKYLIGDINDVSCHPDYRRQGIATNLMKRSIDYMIKKGCDFSILTAAYNGFAQRSIYLKLGYYDFERESHFVQFPNLFQLCRNILGLGILFPVFFTISYIPRFITRMSIKRNLFFRDFSYEINNNINHLKYMEVMNQIIPKYYEGYPKYSKAKFLWARVKVPSKQREPTYILVKKGNMNIGGAVITYHNIYLSKLGFKIRIGNIHEIFVDKCKFNNQRDLYLGYKYLIDKVMKAATRRFFGVLMFEGTKNNYDLNKALKGMNFLKIQESVIMIKELKNHVKFPKIRKPLFVPTYVSLGFP